jgi:hypothetical protein
MWPFVRSVCGGLTRGQKKFWLKVKKDRLFEKFLLTALSGGTQHTAGQAKGSMRVFISIKRILAE